MSRLRELDEETFRTLERLVHYWAYKVKGRYPHTNLSQEDLIQVGWLACEEALRKYDPSRGKLVTYCSFRICGAMIDALRKDPVVRIPSGEEGLARLASSQKGACEHLRPEEPIIPADAETLKAPAPGPEEAIQRKKLVSILEACLERLSPEARLLIVLRFYKEEKLDTLARALGVTVQAVSQKIKRSLGRLRACLEEHHIFVEDIKSL